MKPIYRCRICGRYTENEYHCGTRAELVLDGKKRTALSKLMSFILRHDPGSVGLELDPAGWVSIKDLVNGIRTRWRNAHLYSWVREEHIIAIAMLDPKGRFEIRNGFIRARYGHNRRLGIRIDYEEDKESRWLYHGTAKESLEPILREGIKPMNRQYVHLTISFTDACEVGRRHSSKPIVLVIDVECLRRSGYVVYKASPSVRVVTYVPPKCISKVYSC